MSGAINKLSVPTVTNRRLAIVRIVGIALLLALSGNLLQAGQAKPKKHDNRNDIYQLEEAWRNSMLKGDTAAMSALLADDYISITASGILQTKDEALANMRARRVHFTTLDVSDRKVRIYGNTALVNSLASVQGVTAEGEVSGSYRYTRVYVRNPQGQWKIVSFEASRIRQPGERRKQGAGTKSQ
jgi:ketosteroid isomerase-like protein